MKNKICGEAIQAFGAKSQIDKALEELIELSLALHHYQDNKVNVMAVQEEIADVKIMMHQLSIMFGVDEISTIETQKLLRLQQLIKTKMEVTNEFQ